MSNVADTDLEGCIKELAKRVRHDLVGKTPLEVDDYFLCRSIEHVVRVDSRIAPTVVTDIESYRHGSCRHIRHDGEGGWRRTALSVNPDARDMLQFSQFHD